ncbi:MAG: hypothetical protein BHW65_04540 [Verrucomicrobia bacterium CAG:312_58_20]|nr:MAG: hypothetical protein BHW65_04540 [Verrucomicrobia bacterium CAG:312_58_20]
MHILSSCFFNIFSTLPQNHSSAPFRRPAPRPSGGLNSGAFARKRKYRRPICIRFAARFSFLLAAPLASFRYLSLTNSPIDNAAKIRNIALSLCRQGNPFCGMQKHRESGIEKNKN